MGKMLLKDFRDELNMTLGEKAQSANEPLDRWINRAYTEVTARDIFEQLNDVATIDMVAGTRDYDLPEGALSVISMADLSSKKRIIYTALRNFDLQAQTSAGKPKLWTRRGDKFLFWPTPNAVGTIQVQFQKEPDWLVEEDDATIIPARWDHAIVLLSARNAWLTFRENERATLNHQAAMEYMQSILKESDTSMGQPAMGVRLVDSWDDLTDMSPDFPG